MIVICLPINRKDSGWSKAARDKPLRVSWPRSHAGSEGTIYLDVWKELFCVGSFREIGRMPRKYLFADESGNLDFHTGKGSKCYAVGSVVIDAANLKDLRERVAELGERLSWTVWHHT